MPALVDGQSVLLPIDVDAVHASGLDALLGHVPLSLEKMPFPLSLQQQQMRAIQLLALSDVTELEQLAAALNDSRRYLDGTMVGLFLTLPLA